MRKFIVYSTFFLVPLIAFGVLSEWLLRCIPNDYTLKKHYLDQKADSVVILFLGNSHVFYGINPDYMTPKSFNAAYPSQSLKEDWDILKKYKDDWHSLQCVVLPIDYLTLFYSLESGIESWRVKNYAMYYGMYPSSNIKDYSEMLNSKFGVNLSRIYDYYKKNKVDITCNSLGWGFAYDAKNNKDLVETGIEAAKRHTIYSDKYFHDNMNLLYDILRFTEKRQIRVVFFTPPAYQTYIKNLDRLQLNKTIEAAKNLTKQHPNASYVNWLSDDTFTTSDFYDADHMNNIGSKKLTLKMDTLVRSLLPLSHLNSTLTN